MISQQLNRSTKMEKEIVKGTIKYFTVGGATITMEDGTDNFISGERNMLFKDLEVGDKVILESVIENNSMTLSISKQEEPVLLSNNRTGVGRSYWKENLMKNSFIIDTSQETEESFVEKLKEAKGQKEKIILLAGVDFIACPPMITHFMQSGLKATVIIEDIHKIHNTPKLDEIDWGKIKSDRELNLKITETYKPESIKPFDKPNDYCHGKQPELSFKRGGNNRKTKNRKKAKNGRSKK